jgi:hypothetical protein
MDYKDCQKIVEAVKPILTGTNYEIDYYLDGEISFTFNGEWVDFEELPEHLQQQISEATEQFEIEY